jgi:cytochrome c-type biogenesis protein CcmF
VLSLLGSAAVVAALLGALLSVVAGYWGGFKQRPAATDASRYGIYFVFACMTVAVAAMEVALLTHDFSVTYVAEVGSRSTPAYFTAISLWSSLDGSILFWGWILSAYALLVAWVTRKRHPRFTPFVNGTLMIVGLFFFGLLAGPANPFGHLSPAPADGPGPNPLLQNHPLMGLHPPLLYLGYVGMAVPFSFGIAALLSGNITERWLQATRRWTLAPWAFLSLGIVAGAWWSYDVLGWGGYWAWDPVENASFLPWLTATAFLHSAMVQERRGMLKTWNLSLIVGTFMLTLFGTFLTRSGVLDSVHAFTEGAVGPALLGFVALVTIVTLALIGWRSDRLHAPGTLEGAASRETAFILNNLLFVALTFTILLGTIFPLLMEATKGARISVGPPYFDMLAAPIGLLLLFLMGIGPELPWGAVEPGRVVAILWRPVAVGVVAAGILVALGVRAVYPVITAGLGAFTMTTIVDEFRKGMRARRRISGARGPRALWELLSKNGRRYGGYVVHTGIVVVIVALSISQHWRTEREVTLHRGERATLGKYSIGFERVFAREEARRFVVTSEFPIYLGDKQVATMSPQLNYYQSSQQPMTTPAVRSTPAGDLYLTLMAFDRQGESATVRAILNPAVPWLWVGGILVGLGAIVSIRARRKHRLTTGGNGGRPAAGGPKDGEREVVQA